MERAKYLIKEKIKLIKEEIIDNYNNCDKSRTSNTSNLEELEKQKFEKEKLVDKLNLEKEKLRNKVKCYENQRNTAIKMDRRRLKKEDEIIENIEDSNSDNELSNNKATKNKNQIINDIDSDIGDNDVSVHSWQSEFTTNTKSNTNSVTPRIVDYESLQANLFRAKETTSISNYQSEEDIKKQYKNFVKVFLKIKFEKIDSDHPGQKIPEKILFKECLRREVPQVNFHQFIEEEINNFDKYSAYLFRKSGNSKNKNKNFSKNKRPTRITKYNARPLMEIINEESI